MNNIPTAEEFIAKHSINYKKTIEKDEKSLYHLVMNGFEARNAMIEFAKAHVIETLNNAYAKAEVEVFYNDDERIPDIHIKESSILNAYPLENIK